MSQPRILTNYANPNGNGINSYLNEIQPINELKVPGWKAQQIEANFKIVDCIPGVSTVANIGLMMAALAFKVQDLWFHYVLDREAPRDNPLKIYAIEMKSLPQYLIGLVPFVGLIALCIRSCQSVQEVQDISEGPIPSNGYARGKTYEEGSEETICDWIITTNSGGIIHLDGTGHNKASVAKAEHPLLTQFAQDWEAFIANFDFTAPHALTRFLEAEYHMFGAFNQGPMRRCLDQYDVLQMAHGQDREALGELIRNQPMTQSSFDQLYAFIDSENLERYILRIRNGVRDESDLYPQIANAFECLTRNDFENFLTIWNEIWTNQPDEEQRKIVNSEFSKVLKEFAKDSPPSRRAGSAFGLTQPLSIGEGYIFFRNLADVCLMVMSPKGEQIELDAEGRIDLNSVNISWVGLVNNQLGDCAEATHQGVHLLGPYPNGAIALSFSDGIGDFLTREEIAAYFAANAHNGAQALLEAFHQEIQNFAANPSAETRYRATCDVPKPHDTCTQLDRLNPTNYDDTSCGFTVLKPCDGSQLFKKNDPQDSKVSADSDFEP